MFWNRKTVINMTKGKKVLLVLVIILVIVSLGVGAYFFFFKKPVVEEFSVPEVKIMNKIEGYEYTLDERDTELFKEKFNELKSLLESENFSEEEYVNLVSELFIIDLYTIDNKISKYDVGGLEYVYEPAKDSFKSTVMDTIYKTVINNIGDKREQSLPVVSNITVNSVTPSTYVMPDESEASAYTVNISWEYETSLGYDNSGTIELVKNDNRIDVVSFKPEE